MFPSIIGTFSKKAARTIFCLFIYWLASLGTGHSFLPVCPHVLACGILSEICCHPDSSKKVVCGFLLSWFVSGVDVWGQDFTEPGRR